MRWIAVFVLLGVAATLGDLNHVTSGVLRYPGGEQPAWVLALMGTASVGMVGGARLLPDTPLPPAAALTPGAWFLALYFLSGALAHRPALLTALLLAAFAARVGTAWQAWVTSIAAAVGGPLFEAWFSSTGAFTYVVPHPWGVPMWLPALYLNAGLAARAVARSFG